MDSPQLADFLRAGVISPILKRESKESVITKVGEPDDWKGRIEGIGWHEPVIDDFRDAEHWHYGSICVSFNPEGLVSGMSLDYSEALKPISIVDAFTGVPERPFSLRQLIDFLDTEGIEHFRPAGSDICVQTAGDVAVGCRHGECANDSPVNYLFHHTNGEQAGGDQPATRDGVDA